MPNKIFPQSKVSRTLYHYTIGENVEKIKKEGFKTAVELGGTLFGTEMDGIYFTDSVVNYWGGDSATQFEQIAVKVNLKNPLDISFYSDDREDYTEQELALVELFKKLRDQGEDKYYTVNGDNKYNKSLLASSVTKELVNAGYDGLMANGHNGLEYVVFDKNNIHILENEAPKTNVRPTKTPFDLIKKQNGESFAKAIRNYDNGIFDVPNIVEIVKYAGRDADPILKYLGSLKKIEIEDVGQEVLPPPFELLHRAGYQAEYADTLKKQNSIKKYFKSREELCTFRDDARYRNYYILNAVRYDVDKIIRKDFTDPRREDDYGTSVISIQVLKTGGFISIKNRYNHTVNSPDNTFGSNPDNIIDGLSASIKQYFNVDFSSSEYALPSGYVFMNDRLIQYNTEVNNTYFGKDFYVKDGVIYEIDNDTQVMMDNFVFDLKNQWLIDIADSEDEFIDQFEDHIKGKKVQVTKGDSGSKIIVVDGVQLVKLYNGRIIEALLPNTKTLDKDRRLLRNCQFIEKIDLPALEHLPPYSNNYTPNGARWYMKLAWENHKKENPTGQVKTMPELTRWEKAKDKLAYHAHMFKRFLLNAKSTLHDTLDLQNTYSGGFRYFTPVAQQEKLREIKESIQKVNAKKQKNISANLRPVSERD